MTDESTPVIEQTINVEAPQEAPHETPPQDESKPAQDEGAQGKTEGEK